MISLPTGTLTFLFSDIEGSTALWQRYPEQMRANLAIHDALLRAAIEHNQGYVFKTVGDAFCAAFQVASQGLHAAIEAQQVLHKQAWGDAPIQVRMGLHTGEAEERSADYFGNNVNRTARLMSAGHGGQILLSLATQELVRDQLPAGVSFEYLGQHRLKDILRPEHIFQLTLPGLPQAFAPLKTMDYQPNNLPAQATPFIGREAELAALKKMLCDPTIRLVTLSGPGGTGKTRLALQAAAELLDTFTDGVFFVPFAAITEPELIPLAITQALELSNSQNLPLVDFIKAALREKEMLLVLDNLEQVVTGAPMLGELLAALPHLKFLATSRILLHLHGEREFRVPALHLPDLKRLPALEQLTQYEAVRLFVQQAQVARPGFQVNNENAPAVAEICHRLDGLPLALELAAARLRLLTPEKLLSQLSQRLRILSGGSRDLPARQQTLRAAIDWSYNLLSPVEQSVFQQLAVFPASFTLEAAESICEPLEGDVFELLEQLIEKSLLKVIDEGNELRFSLLETLREYALEKLVANQGDAAASQRHLQYFLAWAEAIAPYLYQRQMPACLDQLERDYANLSAALEWALGHDPEAGLRLCNALHKFWITRLEYCQGGAQWYEKFLAASSPLRSAGRAWALLNAEMIWRHAGLEHPNLDNCLEESLALAKQLDDHDCVAMVLARLGYSSILKDADSARRLLEEGRAEAELADNDRARSAIQNHLGVLAFYQAGAADPPTQQYFETSLAVSQKLGDFSIWLHDIYMLGVLCRARGDWQAAIRHFQEGLQLAQEIRMPADITVHLVELADLALGTGNFEQTHELLTQARQAVESTPDDYILTYTLYPILGELARLEGDYELAVDYLKDLPGKLIDPATKISTLCYLADAERCSNRQAAALGHYRAAIDEGMDLNRRWSLSLITIPFIAIYAQEGQKPAAAAVLFAWANKNNRDVRYPYYQQDLERRQAQVKERLSEAEYQAARNEGQSLSDEQIIAYALNILQPG